MAKQDALAVPAAAEMLGGKLRQDLKALREHKQQRYRREAAMSVQRGGA